MEKTIVTFSRAKYKDQEILLLGFKYDFELKEYLKKFDGVQWSRSLKSFYVPFSSKIKNNLFHYLQEKNYFIDYSALMINRNSSQKDIVEKKEVLPKLIRNDILREINSFKKWMVQKRYSQNTIKTYESMLLSFFRFHHPKTMMQITEKEVLNFNYNYIIANNFSHTYQNQVINALKLFYTRNGRFHIIPEKFERPKKKIKLPEVLSIEEVKLILVNTNNIKHQTLLSFIYSCGLRIGETLNTKLVDLDLQRQFVHIKSGKGRKDRYVPVPFNMCRLLRKYIISQKPKYFLFEGRNNGKYSPVSARQVLKRSLLKSEIKKSVTLHTLRHSYATHLLEKGTDIRYIQELLGHNDPKTTMIYTHVSSSSLDKIKNPFDEFEI